MKMESGDALQNRFRSDEDGYLAAILSTQEALEERFEVWKPTRSHDERAWVMYGLESTDNDIR